MMLALCLAECILPALAPLVALERASGVLARWLACPKGKLSKTSLLASLLAKSIP